jgi:nanoRNase/pAp phosphatase (c-di-AMP/oligoRNAs hydrolase)
VGLSKSSFRVKVSVGSNPWAPSEPVVNLAKICERYGGGGHARVGAISFDVTHQEAARKAAREIVEELRAAVRAPGQ